MIAQTTCKYCSMNLIRMEFEGKELRLCPTCDKALSFPALTQEPVHG